MSLDLEAERGPSQRLPRATCGAAPATVVLEGEPDLEGLSLSKQQEQESARAEHGGAKQASADGGLF